MKPTSRRRAPGDPHLAVAYLRVSTDDQKLGPEAQRAQIEAWAAREGVSVVSWHVDHGVSGSVDLSAREALLAALVDVGTLRAGVLVVAKRDRVARDVYVASTVDRAVNASGARIVAADGTANGDSAADAFMRTVIDGAAAYERALIRSRTKAALAAKRAKGERVGTAPFGWRARQDGRLEAEPAEQAVVATLRSLRASGRSLRAIVVEAAKLRLVSRAGQPLGLTQVARCLAAPTQPPPRMSTQPRETTQARPSRAGDAHNRDGREAGRRPSSSEERPSAAAVGSPRMSARPAEESLSGPIVSRALSRRSDGETLLARDGHQPRMSPGERGSPTATSATSQASPQKRGATGSPVRPAPKRRKLTPAELDAYFPDIAVSDDMPEIALFDGRPVNLRAFLRENRTNRWAIADLVVELDAPDGRGKVLERPWRHSGYHVNEYGDVSI